MHSGSRFQLSCTKIASESLSTSPATRSASMPTLSRRSVCTSVLTSYFLQRPTPAPAAFWAGENISALLESDVVTQPQFDPNAREDIAYPDWLEGTWSCSSEMTSFRAPLGIQFLGSQPGCLANLSSACAMLPPPRDCEDHHHQQCSILTIRQQAEAAPQPTSGQHKRLPSRSRAPMRMHARPRARGLRGTRPLCRSVVAYSDATPAAAAAAAAAAAVAAATDRRR